MTPLGEKLKRRIAERGPLTLEAWWEAALFDREHGYYTTGNPLGAEGDFITAPEISQMFGELVGAWCVMAWRGLGRPSPFLLAEIGGGRGTLIADLLRAALRLDADFARAARLRLVEVSDRLAAEQLRAVARFDLPARRVRRVEELEALPLILAGNELFDALPIRQIVYDGTAWRERLVGLSPDTERFAFVSGPPLPKGPPGLGRVEAGAVYEASPARSALAAALARHLAANGGAALFFDYGHWTPGPGDTLQALRRHAVADPLADPGRHDITSHVDFAALAQVFRAGGLQVAPSESQGGFLVAMGLLERAGALGAGADEAGRDAIRAAVERLAGSGETGMGALFKVLATASAPLDLPPFVQAPVD